MVVSLSAAHEALESFFGPLQRGVIQKNNEINKFVIIEMPLANEKAKWLAGLHIVGLIFLNVIALLVFCVLCVMRNNLCKKLEMLMLASEEQMPQEDKIQAPISTMSLMPKLEEMQMLQVLHPQQLILTMPLIPTLEDLNRESASIKITKLCKNYLKNRKLKVIECGIEKYPTVVKTIDMWSAKKHELFGKMYRTPGFKGDCDFEFYRRLQQALKDHELDLFADQANIASFIKSALDGQIERKPPSRTVENWDKLLICSDQEENIQSMALFDSKTNTLAYLVTSVENIRHSFNIQQTRGSGSKIMNYLIKQSIRNKRELFLSAVSSAVSFYKQFGFKENGPNIRGETLPMIYRPPVKLPAV